MSGFGFWMYGRRSGPFSCMYRVAEEGILYVACIQLTQAYVIVQVRRSVGLHTSCSPRTSVGCADCISLCSLGRRQLTSRQSEANGLAWDCSPGSQGGCSL